MRTYDDEYFILERPKNAPELPSLVPDENTAARSFRYEAQPLGAPPLVFINGWKDKRLADGVKEIPADILFEGSNLVVRSAIREALLKEDLPNLSMAPSIFIDSKGNWHEDYWYLTFTERFDCWDRAKSDYEPDPLQMGGFDLYSVYSYSLNEEVMKNTPLHDRLLFKMAATQDGYVFCHSTLARLFRGKDRGAELTPVPEY